MKYRLFIFITVFVLSITTVTAQDVSTKKPWGDLENVEVKEPTRLTKVLLWLPNRILDFTDIFRGDVGVGASYGAVVRLTKHGQVGYRVMSPTSVRIGHFGRKSPYLVRMETSNEIGVGPAFIQSGQRQVCRSELGLGADLIVGAYLGICLEEVVDFFAGIFTLDIRQDDLE